MTNWNRDPTEASNSCENHEVKGAMHLYLRKDKDGNDVTGYRQTCCSFRNEWNMWDHPYPVYQKYDPFWNGGRRSPRRFSPRRWRW